MNQNLVFTMCAAGLVLAVLAIVIDRLNFPQRPFRAKQVSLEPKQAARDRTGAHVTKYSAEERPEQ